MPPAQPLPLAMPATGTGTCVWDAGATLGEGAVWSPGEQALYWVDILGRQLNRLTPATGGRTSWTFDEEVSALAERVSAPGLVLALRRGLALWNPADPGTAPRTLSPLDADLPGNRCNDGKCDTAGRFWAGTMDFGCEQPTGSLYRVDASGQATRHDSGFAVTNGPTWTADQRTLLFNDTVNGRVLAYDFDAATGSLANRRVWLQFGPDDGVPDGMCTDAAGRIWICHWGGSCVSCHDPVSTRELGRITLPVSQVTSCAFGGADLHTLYVTSARVGLSAEALAREPLAGGLFAFPVAEPGQLARRFGG